MKIRIRGYSVRLRLLQSEVKQLVETGKVSETIRFGLSEPEVLIYTVQCSLKASEILAGFCQNEICVTIPEAVVKDWYNTDKVSLENKKDLEGDSLHILIEKDFVCLTREDDPDNLDAFPNPEINC